MKRYLPGTGLLALLVVALSLGVAAGPGIGNASAADQAPATVDQVYNIVNPEMSGDKAFANVAYVWRGWRNAGGPWFNQVMSWIGDDIASYGFVEGRNPADPTAPHYWKQFDYRPGSIWMPQYLSMQIVGPEGDADPSNAAAYHFDHPAINTFDPTSSYYPSYMDKDWILSHVGTPEEAAIQDRCHLATSSAFTAPFDTPVAVAETPGGGAIIADVVDVGTVTGSGSATRTWSRHSSTSLAGKILFSQTTSMSNMMTLAAQQGAKAVLTPMGLNAYSDPIINGVELYPNNVRFASGGSSAAPTRISLNISNQDARFLTGLCAQYDQTGSFPQMKLFAIGGTKPYSVAPATDNMLPTVIAEIPGTDPNPAIASQRVVYGAHVQEPGANDNATGVGTLLEMVRTTKHLIDSGALPAPKRTLTFIWGNETIMGSLWKAQNPEAFASTQIFIDLDMVGEDPAKNGGPMRIEKMPDPSARYKYQLDRLPADPVPTPTQFLRQPDSHTLWGAGSLKFWPYPGHYLNDAYFAAASRVKADSPDFDVVGNPWEGGSDHDTFLWNQDGGVYNPKPAVLTWHFTDYVYHSSMDTMDTVSRREMHDVGVTSILSGYDVALADVESANKTLDIVQAAAHQRFAWERDNTAVHFFWALLHPYGSPTSTTDAALHEAFAGTGNSGGRSIGETQLLAEWGTWYQQAVISARTIFDPADDTAAYDEHEAAALAAVANDATEAQANAAHLFAISHFTGTSVAINSGAEWSTSRDVTLSLAASSYAPGGITGVRFSDDGLTWPASFELYAESAAHTLPAGDGAKTVYAQFQDAEGNICDAVNASVKLDTTAPEIALATPVDGATYVKGQAVKADWSVSDAYSGVASSSGTVASGALIDTASFGAKGFGVTASDVAGNSATTTLGYSVPFASAGVLAPLSPTKTVVVNGSTAVVKIQVLDSAGGSVSSLTPALHLAKQTSTGWGAEFDPTSTSAPTTGTAFRYDPKAKQYVYSLNTKLLAAGTYRLRIDLGDGGEMVAQIQVK